MQTSRIESYASPAQDRIRRRLIVRDRERGLTDESVHVEDPVGGVDLSESGDVHWEAPVWKNHSEHFVAFAELQRVLQRRVFEFRKVGEKRTKFASLEASRKVQMVVDRAGSTAGGNRLIVFNL